MYCPRGSPSSIRSAPMPAEANERAVSPSNATTRGNGYWPRYFSSRTTRHPLCASRMDRTRPTGPQPTTATSAVCDFISFPVCLGESEHRVDHSERLSGVQPRVAEGLVARGESVLVGDGPADALRHVGRGHFQVQAGRVRALGLEDVPERRGL